MAGLAGRAGVELEADQPGQGGMNYFLQGNTSRSPNMAASYPLGLEEELRKREHTCAWWGLVWPCDRKVGVLRVTCVFSFL